MSRISQAWTQATTAVTDDWDRLNRGYELLQRAKHLEDFIKRSERERSDYLSWNYFYDDCDWRRLREVTWSSDSHDSHRLKLKGRERWDGDSAPRFYVDFDDLFFDPGMWIDRLTEKVEKLHAQILEKREEARVNRKENQEAADYQRFLELRDRFATAE